MTLDDFETLVFAYGTACIERDDGLSDSGEPLAALVSAFEAAKAEVPEAAQEEIAQLRAALEENYVVDMVSPQYEADHTIEISDGWACAYCDLGDGNANRPSADEKAGVTHVAGCPLYRADLEPARLAALKAAGEEACREIGIDPGAATGRQVDSGACEP